MTVKHSGWEGNRRPRFGEHAKRSKLEFSVYLGSSRFHPEVVEPYNSIIATQTTLATRTVLGRQP